MGIVTSEPLIKGQHSETSGFDDTPVNSEMYSAKSQTVESQVRDQGSEMATPHIRGVESASESRPGEGKTASLAMIRKAKNVTAMEMAITKSTEAEVSGDMAPQREPYDDKSVSLPTLKDEDLSGPLKAKSKIPIRITPDVKSSMTPDKTSVMDASDSLVTLKLQKQPRTNETFRANATTTKGDISSTKPLNKTEKKPFLNLVNSMEKDQDQHIIKTGQPADGEIRDVKKQELSHQENNTSNSSLSISSCPRKRNKELFETVQKQSPEKKQDATPGERPGNEIPIPESPHKGKTVRFHVIHMLETFSFFC